MAGNYPNSPSWRMALDKDGTQGYKIGNGIITQMTNSELVALNDESVTSGVVLTINDPNRIAFLFPERRDIDGFFVANNAGGTNAPLVPQVSTDTTNGLDGTWTNLGDTIIPPHSAIPEYRTGIHSRTALGVIGIRFGWSVNGQSSNQFQPCVVHLYGEITAGQSLDRLLLWHPTLDERVSPAYFDWGDVPRNTTATRDFRVKNVSGAKTANTVRVAMEALSDSAPSAPGQHALSLSGGTYLAQQTISTLAPGEISPVLTLRRITPANAQLSLTAFRVFSEAASWT